MMMVMTPPSRPSLSPDCSMFHFLALLPPGGGTILADAGLVCLRLQYRTVVSLQRSAHSLTPHGCIYIRISKTTISLSLSLVSLSQQ
jgi:hypothetical protein